MTASGTTWLILLGAFFLATFGVAFILSAIERERAANEIMKSAADYWRAARAERIEVSAFRHECIDVMMRYYAVPRDVAEHDLPKLEKLRHLKVVE